MSYMLLCQKPPSMLFKPRNNNLHIKSISAYYVSICIYLSIYVCVFVI